MKTAVVFLLFVVVAVARGEQVAELEPIEVRATIELRQQPLHADHLLEYLSRRLDEGRTKESISPIAPLWNAQFWRYLPALQSSNGDPFALTPNYLRPEYQNLSTELRKPEHHKLFP